MKIHTNINMGQMGEPCISKKKISVFPHSQNSFPIFYSIREGCKGLLQCGIYRYQYL